MTCSFKAICRTRFCDWRTKRRLYASSFGEHNKVQLRVTSKCWWQQLHY